MEIEGGGTEIKQTKTTIDEVASKAGVSKTTISRYLNGHYEFMSEETRKRIEEVVETLGYRPNNLARGLKSNKSGLIGAIISDITNPFFAIVLKGIGDYCQEKGYQIIIANTDNEPELEKKYIQSLIDNRIEGLIVNSTGQNIDYLLSLQEQGLPIVLTDRALPELKFDTVTSNNFAMTTQTVQYLFDVGFQRVAFFTEETNWSSSRHIRQNAFLHAYQLSQNIEAHDLVYVIDNSNPKSIEDALQRFRMAGETKKQAVMAVNGVTLLNLLQEIRKLNLAMPDDLGVCGYDDMGWATLIPPGITAISQPSYMIGVESAKMLINRIIGKRRKAKPKLLELPSELIVRGSTSL
ncbi:MULTISPECIES: LacI family DNA-binding transcriptional regulator [Desulfosporosinus]